MVRLLILPVHFFLVQQFHILVEQHTFISLFDESITLTLKALASKVNKQPHRPHQ